MCLLCPFSIKVSLRKLAIDYCIPTVGVYLANMNFIFENVMLPFLKRDYILTMGL